MERPLIAIVNTDPSFLELMRELLHDEGYATLTLTDHQQACAIMLPRQPQLLILELRITDPERAWRVVTTMRMHPQTASIPIIVATTAAQLIGDHGARVRLQDCYILLMPFDVDELLAMVGAILPAPTVHTEPHRICADCSSSASRR
jgi:DNA-binding response OmpR family regulator